jgi:2-oxoglutarate ferredoxin oxidoreductase subunit gamma
VEREILMTGIGGQGVQLASEVLAQAALAEGLDAQLFGSYGGMMRGGNTDATLVLAGGRVDAPPTVGSAWAVVLVHPAHAQPVLDKVRDDGVVLLNSSLFETALDPRSAECRVVEVPATELAAAAGNVVATSMVMLGALSGATGVVSLESLRVAAGASIPPYRRQHLERNERALEAGARAVSPLELAPWPAVCGARGAPA